MTGIKEGIVKLCRGLLLVGVLCFLNCANLSAEEVTGYYVPYEGAAYSLSYVVKDGGVFVGMGEYATENFGDLVIPAEIAGMPVVGINDYAFYGCRMLTGELKLPDTITYIGEYAFGACSSLTGDLKQLEKVTVIGDYAFTECKNLTGAPVLSAGLTEVGEGAFYNCSGLTGQLTLSDSVVKIGAEAFEGCSNLSGELKLPGGLTEIGEKAFKACSGLTGQLILPDSLVKVGAEAFYGCSGFTGDLLLPDGITQIGRAAFENCSGFSGTLQLPEALAVVSERLFQNCYGFKGELKLSNGVTEIGDRAFAGCSGFPGELHLPEKLTAIGNGAFKGCGGFTGGLCIPDTVLTVGYEAFEGCSGFNGELTLSSGMKVIETEAFWDCNGFTGTLRIPEGIITIGIGAFGNCSGFDGELVLANSVEEISNDAFSGCSNLKGELIIPDRVTEIKGSAFKACSGFGGLKLGKQLRRIEDSAFENCTGFTGELILPESVTTIKVCAFWGCGGFTGDLILPEGVTELGSCAFYECTGFDGKLFIPGSVKIVEDNIVGGCTNLKQVVIGRGVESIVANAFWDCMNIEEVYFEGDALSDFSFLKDLSADVSLYYMAYSEGWDEVITGLPEYYWEMYYHPATLFVQRMYTVALGREAEEDGCKWWSNVLLAGESDGAGLAYGFLLGDEFKNKGYGNEEYVAVLYDTFFNREIAEGEGDFWVSSLQDGVSRESVLSGFVNSEEFFALCAEYGILRGTMLEDGTAINSGIGKFAERLYTEVLGRAGEESGMEYWAMSIANGDCAPKDAAMNFFQSDEYLSKNSSDEEYVKALYRTFMDRDCDEGGLEYWVNTLSSGTTRESVLAGFAESEEFQIIMAGYGL